MTNLFFFIFGKKKKKKNFNSARLVIQKAKRRRELAQEKIDGMMATLDGCGDRWFLQPRQTIDECQDERLEGADKNRT